MTDPRGVGRPREYDDRVGTVVRIPLDLHARLKAAAAERDVSANRLIIRAIEEYLDRLPSVADVLRSEP